MCLYGRLFSANRLSNCGESLTGHNHCLARFVPVCYVLSSLADTMQLGGLQAHDKLYGHVRLLQRNGYCLGYHDSLPAGNIYPKTPIKPGIKTGFGRDFWVGHFVRFYLILMVWHRLIYMKAASLLPSPV